MKKKYNETGKRSEVIKMKTVQKSGFQTEQELADEIRTLIEQNTPISQMVKRLNIGRDAINRIKKDYGIGSPDRASVIQNGVREKYGVDNVMDVEEIRNRQKEVVSKVFEERGEEIVQKTKATLLEKTGVEHALQDPKTYEKYRQTCLERYGVNHNSSIPGRSSAIYKLVSERNGGTHPIQNSFHHRSSGEINMEQTLKERFPNIEVRHSVRNLLGDGREIDIFLPEYNIGIEYCGLYAHSELGAINLFYKKHGRRPTDEEISEIVRTTKQRHVKKYEDAKKGGVQLLTVWCSEWSSRKEQILNFIGSKLQTNKTLYARKCEVVEINKQEACLFNNRNHIQEITPHSISRSFGLFYEDQLVGVMIFGLHQRNSKEVVLRRMCFETGITVVGGASKLFHFSTESMMFDRCVSWSDNRWSDGNVYQKLGFLCDTHLPPDYIYLGKNGKIIHKQSATKQKLGAAPGQSEHERAIELGMTRVWDCGKVRWVWTR